MMETTPISAIVPHDHMLQGITAQENLSINTVLYFPKSPLDDIIALAMGITITPLGCEIFL
ncbi:MAG: hypothetical protein QXU02_05370 [Candidatus Bathyarchaeia archaeon]